jgi:hypothetical protein
VGLAADDHQLEEKKPTPLLETYISSSSSSITLLEIKKIKNYSAHLTFKWFLQRFMYLLIIPLMCHTIIGD